MAKTAVLVVSSATGVLEVRRAAFAHSSRCATSQRMQATSPMHAQPARAVVSGRATIAGIAGFWVIWLALVTARAAAMGWPDQTGMLLRRLVLALAGVLLALAISRALLLVRHRPIRQRAAAGFLLAVPATIVFATLNTFVFYRWFPVPSTLPDLARWEPHQVIVTAIADGLVTWYFFFAAWVAFHLAIGLVAEVRATERARAAADASRQTAELAMLRAQVDPHFLFNALNSLASLVATGQPRPAGAMIRDLAAFFRTGLVADATADVTLAEEIEHQRLYLAVERARFGERLQVEFDVPDDVGGVRLPALLLQPLVENTVKHGLAVSSAPVRIVVSAHDEGAVICLSVYNSLPAAGAAAATRSSGIGLANVRARLAARFGSAATLSTGPAADGGWTSKLTVPRG